MFVAGRKRGARRRDGQRADSKRFVSAVSSSPPQAARAAGRLFRAPANGDGAGRGVSVVHHDLHATRLPVRAADGLSNRVYQCARHHHASGDHDRSLHGLYDDLHAALHRLPPTGALCAVHDLLARVSKCDHHDADGLPHCGLIRSTADGMRKLHADQRGVARQQPLFASFVGGSGDSFGAGHDARANGRQWRNARSGP